MSLQVEYLQSLIAIISPSKRSIASELGRQLETLFSAVGVPVDEDSSSIEFREAVDSRPSERDKASEFRKIAKAKNPLDPSVCSVSALGMLNARARKTWAKRLAVRPLNRKYHLIGVEWDMLSEWQQNSVREMALDLAREHQQRVRAGAPQKADQDTLMIGLAEIFLTHTEQQIDPLDLPAAADSVFISFVRAALAPFFDTTLVTKKALSNRWARIKREAKSDPGPIKPVKRIIRRRSKPLN